MDMTCVDGVVATADPDVWRPGDSWLAGGTVLFSYGTDITRGTPRRLLDLTEAGWPETRWVRDAGGRVTGLELAATCRIAHVYSFAERAALPLPRAELPGLELFAPCCDSFVASWKIWNVSTVGGNVATALPAGPMISLLAGLEATALLLSPGGYRRRVAVTDLVLNEAKTALGEGELIRSFHLPLETLGQPCSFRRLSLTERGRSAVLLIGRRAGPGRVRITVTAATRRPYVVDLGPGSPFTATATGLRQAICAVVNGGWHDDIHGTPQWRAAMTQTLGEEILGELLGPVEGAGLPAGRVTGDITMTSTGNRP